MGWLGAFVGREDVESPATGEGAASAGAIEAGRRLRGGVPVFGRSAAGSALAVGDAPGSANRLRHLCARS